MSTCLSLPPDGQGDRRPRRRIVVFIIVLALGAALLGAGRDLQAVLLTLAGVGLVGAIVARWVVDGTGVPNLLGGFGLAADAGQVP